MSKFNMMYLITMAGIALLLVFSVAHDTNMSPTVTGIFVAMVMISFIAVLYFKVLRHGRR